MLKREKHDLFHFPLYYPSLPLVECYMSQAEGWPQLFWTNGPNEGAPDEGEEEKHHAEFVPYWVSSRFTELLQGIVLHIALHLKAHIWKVVLF